MLHERPSVRRITGFGEDVDDRDLTERPQAPNRGSIILEDLEPEAVGECAALQPVDLARPGVALKGVLEPGGLEGVLEERENLVQDSARQGRIRGLQLSEIAVSLGKKDDRPSAHVGGCAGAPF